MIHDDLGAGNRPGLGGTEYEVDIDIAYDCKRPHSLIRSA